MSVSRAALRIALVAALALASAPAAAHAGGLATGIEATQVGGSFKAPVYVTSAPGFPKLVFVVEKGGVVRVLRGNKRVKRPFLDISGRVSKGSEQGLLSIAFPPNYRSSRRFYAYYTSKGCKAGSCDIAVTEFQRSKKSATRALVSKARRVITIRHRNAPNHNGGTAMFGPDGMLWLGTGDGGFGQQGNSAKRSSLLGKLLRIDPRKPKSRKAKRGYRIPKDNPFVGGPGRDEIWSIGLRNPFRFSFDEERGMIAIGDVGETEWEELNYVDVDAAKGANFGWPRYEGLEERGGALGPGPLIDPVHVYPHSGNTAPRWGGASIIGGVVLRDPRFAGVLDLDPSVGRYLYADAFDNVPVRSLVWVGPGVTDHQLLPGVDPQSPAGFGTDQRGRVWLADRTGGRVYRLDPAS
ncbi:MAG TPA: PQQ-dependent sugar dehydrogenase [Solirubrobacterales bacterium]|jgi:glucose/arabinose dehydrogenase